MGVLNVTPDSFSDGGRYFDVGAAVARGEEMVREGADLLDIGGESTRPTGAEPIDAGEELRRVLPVLRELRGRVDVPISIDTYKGAVAEEALAAGADLINDISGLRWDPQMTRVAAASGAPVILGHSRGGREELHREHRYEDVCAEVAAELEGSLRRAEAAGISRQRVIVDPGIGFSKSAHHNLPLLRDLSPVCALGCPVLVGVSRKSFLGRITGRGVGERLMATAAATVAAILAGAHMVRVHDVAPLLDAVRVADAIRRAAIG
jgi:dihydropteroate synthase